MKRIRVIHRLRTAMLLLGFLAVVGAGVGLWWINHIGLPESWRDEIEDALAAHGLHTEISSLSYHPFHGIEASEVIMFSDAQHTRTVARLNGLLLVVDRTRLSRGHIKIERLDLAGARLDLAVDPDDPRSKTLEIGELSGRILFLGGRKVDIQNASGMVGGVQLRFDGAMLGYRPRHIQDPESEARAREQRKVFLTAVINSIERWGPQGDTTPGIRIIASGDLEDPSSLRATIAAQGYDLHCGAFDIHNLDIQAELRGPVIVLHQGEIRSANGHIRGSLEYDLSKETGVFEASASIDPDLEGLLETLRLPIPENLPSFAAPSKLDARCSFTRLPEGDWDVTLIGNTELDHPRYLHFSADHLATSFSWDGSRLFLEDLLVREGDNQLTGRVFVTPEAIQYEAHSSLTLGFWQNAVRLPKLSKVLHDLEATEQTKSSVDFNGMVDLKRKGGWTFDADVEASNIAYRGVPATRASVTLDLDSQVLDFTDGSAEFDYRNYPLRKAFGGPPTGQLEVGRIRYDRQQSTVTIEKVRGTAWPAPVVRTFASGLADHIEDYRFHRPPQVSADGVIGVLGNEAKNDLLVRFSSKSPASYRFIGEDLTLIAPEGEVSVGHNAVNISDLSFGLCDGLLRGDLKVKIAKTNVISGELDWTNISLPKLAATYDSKARPKGLITGRIAFSQRGSEISGLDGNGHLALNDGELFDVPIFGPLSSVISAVLGKHSAGFQEAKDAFFTFKVREGILSTNDFLTTTTSLVFTGDAITNLKDKTFEMTVRMNARGLFGVITLPLRPFYGLFQFRGRGSVEKAVWKKVVFTSPPKDQNAVLMAPPKARAIAPPP